MSLPSGSFKMVRLRSGSAMSNTKLTLAATSLVVAWMVLRSVFNLSVMFSSFLFMLLVIVSDIWVTWFCIVVVVLGVVGDDMSEQVAMKVLIVWAMLLIFVMISWRCSWVVRGEVKVDIVDMVLGFVGEVLDGIVGAVEAVVGIGVVRKVGEVDREYFGSASPAGVARDVVSKEEGESKCFGGAAPAGQYRSA